MKHHKASGTCWVRRFLLLLLSFLITNVVWAAEVRVKGKVESYVIDRIDGKHELKTFVIDKVSKKRIELLNVAEDKAQRLSGKDVSVKGIKKNADQLEVSDIAYDGSTSTSSGGGLPNANGIQKVLVYLINFQDKPDEKPWSVAQVQDYVFNYINSYFLEVSSGRTSLSGTVAGWYTIALDSTVCDGFGIQNKAQAAATSAGIDISQYTRHVFLFPPNSGCGYSGMGQVGAMPSSSWINGSFNLRTIGHELLHNLGLHHSHALDCPGAPLVSSFSNCSTQEYGNTVDILGYTGTVGHISAYQKYRLGWLSSSEIVEVSAAGDYLISPLSVANSQVKALRIHRGLDATSGLEEWFFVEYRKPLNFDALIVERGVVVVDNIFNGAVVTLIRGDIHGYLLDMTPDSSFVDMKDAALLPGASFADPVSGISLLTLSSDSSGVSVRVSGSSAPPPPPPPADTTAPTVGISSPGNGTTVSGTVSISAQASDNVAVSKVEFYIDGVMKFSDNSSPYSYSWDSKSVANGSHTIVAKAYDSSNNTSSKSISVNVNNVVADTTPPTVVISSPANGSVFSPRTTVTIVASASDNVAVSRVDFYVNGSLTCSDSSASYTCVYKLGGTKGASYLIEAYAFDSSGNVAKHQIVIQTSGSGGGGSNSARK